ncbi:MAG: hypothetical protein U0230_20725 [Polyangiales bacterium]
MTDAKESWRERLGLADDPSVEELGSVRPPTEVGYGLTTDVVRLDPARTPERLRGDPSFVDELELARATAARLPGLAIAFWRTDSRYVVVGGLEPERLVGESTYAPELGTLLLLAPDSEGAAVYECEGGEIWIAADAGMLHAWFVPTRAPAWAEKLDVVGRQASHEPSVPSAIALVTSLSLAPWLRRRLEVLEASPLAVDRCAALGHVARFALASHPEPTRALQALLRREISSPAEAVMEKARAMDQVARDRVRAEALDRVGRCRELLSELPELVSERSPDAASAARLLRHRRNELESVAVVLRGAGDLALDDALADLDRGAESWLTTLDVADPGCDDELAEASVARRGIWWGPSLQ